jgi:phosphate transport system substrate-binding protein
LFTETGPVHRSLTEHADRGATCVAITPARRSTTLRHPRLVLTLTAISIAALFAVPAAASAAPITMSGSTSIYPLVLSLAKKYVKTKHVKFKVAQGGSDVGVDDVAHGRVTIGDSSRDPLPSDPHGLTWNKIARDGICVITNPSNTVPSLNQAQVQQIFSGRVRDWGKISGAKAKGSIDIITRTASSGTADAFQNIFMGTKLRIAANAAAKNSNGLVQQAVHSDKNAIGFVSFDFIKGTRPVPYKGVACTLRNAKSGSYTGVRNFWMVTRGAPKGATSAWIKWIQNSSAARSIINTHWLPRK